MVDNYKGRAALMELYKVKKLSLTTLAETTTPFILLG